MKTRYLDLDDRTEDLRELMRDEKARSQEFLAKFEVSFLYHENALEGVVFSSSELIAALDPKQVAHESSLAHAFAEVRNHKAALEFIRDEAKGRKNPITLTNIKKLHDMVAGLEGKDDPKKSGYRKDMPLHRTYFHDIAQPSKIQAGLDKLLDFVGTSDFKELHTVEQAAQVQWMFMQAYPYTDHNGKVARLLSNTLLLRGGYLPAIIHTIDRQRYYESFRLSPMVLRDLLLEAMENSLDNAFKFFSGEAPVRMPRVAGH